MPGSHCIARIRRASNPASSPRAESFDLDLAGDAAYLDELLRTISGPIVLVGHSYGGNVISTAAIGNDQVRALGYLNGWMNDVGESQQQRLEKFEGSLVGPSIRPVPFTNPDGSQGTDLYLAPEAFREAFGRRRRC
jgi:pimeloyl-ACP methyl ester carboxylesterase